eukprot:TRINITY_DN12971_c0_g1_i1.p1 TRINITY_DN12971_c0_g1~~TRINITY_DN12971_c0_g1_i1.p1  ORF type:complete len:180 (-),score=39.89 TRINITY_DN12971_c0_g1_i1:244-783(-)
MSGNILQSLPLDTTKAFWGLPFCATGKQPAFPEETESLIQKLPSGALEPLVKKLNKVFKDTGCPFFPLGLLWLVFIVSLLFNFKDYIGFNGQMILRCFGIVCGLIWAIIGLVCQTKRRKDLASSLEQWNRSDGATYGVHVKIGGKDGAPLSSCRCGKAEVFLHVFDGPGEADIGCCFQV